MRRSKFGFESGSDMCLLPTDRVPMSTLTKWQGPETQEPALLAALAEPQQPVGLGGL